MSSINSPTNLIAKPTHAHQANTAIKAVALYEIAKGVLALLVAGAVFLWHAQLPDIVAKLVHWLHHVFGRFLISPIDSLTHGATRASENWQMAFWLIIGYALLRFVEAYGLWKDRTWAYWFSVLGYGIFIPVELMAIVKHPDGFAILTFVLNIIIVIIVYRNMKRKGLI